MKILIAILCASLTVPIAGAQSSAPAFEVASVKRNKSGSGNAAGPMVRGDRVIATNVNLTQLIRSTFGVQEFQIAGKPGWADSYRFDIEAKTEAGSKPENWQRLMETLLAERFKLAFHREQRQASILKLVVAKNGPKLTPADPSKCCNLSATPTEIAGTSVTMERLATRLSRSIGQIVTDNTGLNGSFDLKLEWPREDVFNGAGASASTGIFAALQDQLGLRLESARAPVETIVIDHAEPPAEN